MHLAYFIEMTFAQIAHWLALLPLTASNQHQKPIGTGSNPFTGTQYTSSRGPIFAPPGGIPSGPGSDFLCDYSNMPGWSPCWTNENQGCWLRNEDGDEFNIETNYEAAAPIGVERNYTIVIADGSINADGINFIEAKVFNQIFPGPLIEACWGDKLNVEVINNMAYNGTSIHWHGIRQNFTMQMDGVNGVSQCPIAPGDSAVYTFDTTQYGSSWYHSHFSVQYADGAQGPITIYGPTSAPYDEAVYPLIMTDWSHDSAFLSSLNRTLDQPSILLDGRGNVTRFGYKDELSIPQGYEIVIESADVSTPAKRYLMRLINTSFSTTFVFSIDNHKLQVVGTDFVPIHPYTTESVLVAIGQRYHIVVEADPQTDAGGSNPLPSSNDFWIRTFVADGCGQQGIPGYERTGVLRYDNDSQAEPSSLPWPNLPTTCSDEPYSSLIPIVPWQVGSAVNGDDGEHFNLSLPSPDDPLPFPLAGFALEKMLDPVYDPLQVNYSDPMFLNFGNLSGDFPDSWVVIPENYTSQDWVYIAISGNGSDVTFGAHPIHLHGHDFAILQQAANTSFTQENLALKFDNPPRRDVILLPTDGFIVIAFKTDNPGSWLMHCHIAFHASSGLGMQILERQGDANKLWPEGSAAVVEAQRVCRNWQTWEADCDNWWPGVDPDTGVNPSCEAGSILQTDSGV